MLFASGQQSLAQEAQGAGAATAVDSSADGDTGAAGAATAVDSSADGDTGAIVVTARRRNEEIQDTPVAVTAVSTAQLEQLAAPDLEALKGTVPNLIIDPVVSGPNGAAIAIRGISFEDIEKSFDPAVGVVIDGVYFGTNTGQLADFFDIESIEVLRGPQGTLFGRNTTGGVINIRRTSPTGRWGADLRGRIGNYGQYGASAVINAPVIEGLVALKLYENHTRTGGWVRNVTKGVSAPRTKTNNFGAAVLITPSDAIDLKLTYDRYELDSPNNDAPSPTSLSAFDLICRRNPTTQRPLSGVPIDQCDRGTGNLYTTFSNETTYVRFDQNTYIADLVWRLSDDLTLTSITSRLDSKEATVTDFDGSSITYFSSDRNQSYRQFSQELRLGGEIGIFNYVIGGFYFENGYNSRNFTNFGPFFQALGRPARATLVPDYDSRSIAAFADVDIQLTEALRVSVGGRYTEDKKELTSEVPGFFVASSSFKGSKFTPKVSVDYKISPDAMAYASYSEGYRSGGVNGRGATRFSIATTYRPETVTAYEAGLKTSFFDRRLTVNVAAFYTDYKDKQESIMRLVPTGQGANAQETVTANAASATLKGFELEVTARPVTGLTLNGALGILDAKYDDFLANDAFGTPIDRSTLELRRTPDVTARAGAVYTWDTPEGTVSLLGEYIYIAEYQTVINPDPFNPLINDVRGLVDAQNNVNASISFVRQIGDTELGIRLYGRNLLDDRGLGSATIVPGLFGDATARAPRMYGIETSLKF